MSERYARPTMTNSRKREPRPHPERSFGRPLEAAERPTINGLVAMGRGDARVSTPPEKENRRGDDVFIARAELKALEALNRKLTGELCSMEERYQALELERGGAVAERDRVVGRIRHLEHEAATARRDASRAGDDAARREEAARAASTEAVSARRDADVALKNLADEVAKRRRAEHRALELTNELTRAREAGEREAAASADRISELEEAAERRTGRRVGRLQDEIAPSG